MRRLTSRLAAAIALAAVVATAPTATAPTAMAATATSATAAGPPRPELGRNQAAPPTDDANHDIADWWF